jgi:hypothetical protein
MAIIAFRSSWPWGLENLLAPPQALEFVPACTGKAVVPVLEWEVPQFQFPRLCLMCVDVSTYQFNLNMISGCMSCQHRHSYFRNIDSFIFHRLRLGLSDPSLSFSRPSRTRSRRLSSPVASFQSIHGSSDDGTRRRARDRL